MFILLIKLLTILTLVVADEFFSGIDLPSFNNDSSFRPRFRDRTSGYPDSMLNDDCRSSDVHFEAQAASQASSRSPDSNKHLQHLKRSQSQP
jgi:hypothetical protein